MIPPPYSSVRLVEYWDRLELSPVGWVRDCVGLGKFKANKLGFKPGDVDYEKWNAQMGDNEIWVVVNWNVFENEYEEVDRVIYCRPNTTLEDAKRVFEWLKDYLDSSPKDRDTEAGMDAYMNQMRSLAAPLGSWLRQKNLDKADKKPRDADAIIHSYSDQKTNEIREMYQARLKVMAGMGPKTVALMHQAEEVKDESQRKKLEREAVDAYFAELGTYWTPDMVIAWQRNNPVAPKWLCEFARLLGLPERRLDPIKHEIVLNWLRRGYNFMTETDLSEAIYKATGLRVKPNTAKKKRLELGLKTKRPFGPWPKPWQ